MKLDEETIKGLNMVLTEATLFGASFNDLNFSFTIDPIALDKDGTLYAENRVSFFFKDVGRFVGSYRNGAWNDANTEVLKFAPEQIGEKVDEFNKLPLAGGKFFDCGDGEGQGEYSKWKDRLSFDYQSGKDLKTFHTLDLFQDGRSKNIDMRIWFDEFVVYNPNGYLTVEEVIERAKRGVWAVNAGNKMVCDRFLIYPGKPPYDLSKAVPRAERGGTTSYHSPEKEA